MEEVQLKPDEKIREQIKFSTEVIRWIIVFVLSLGGGVLSLVINATHSRVSYILITAGTILVLALARIAYFKYSEIRKQID